MEPSDLIGLAGVPVIVAIVQMVKPFVEDRRFYPLVALLSGVLLNLAVVVAAGGDPRRAALAGIVAGLAASGLYSQARAVAS